MNKFNNNIPLEEYKIIEKMYHINPNSMFLNPMMPFERFQIIIYYYYSYI
jgi:hypothetical protein